MAIAPWLQPPNYLQAMTSGAEIGLNARRQDQAQLEATRALIQRQNELAQQRQSAADALREKQNEFALDLNQRQTEAAGNLQARQSQAAANAALAAAQLAQQAGYHEEAKQARDAAQALRDRHESFLEDQKKSQETRGKIIHESGNGIYKVNPDGTVATLQKFNKTDPFDSINYREMLAERRRLYASLAKAESDDEKNTIYNQIGTMNYRLAKLQEKHAAAGSGELAAASSNTPAGDALEVQEDLTRDDAEEPTAGEAIVTPQAQTQDNAISSQSQDKSTMRVRRRSDGMMGTIPADEFDEKLYETL